MSYTAIANTIIADRNNRAQQGLQPDPHLEAILRQVLHNAIETAKNA